AIEAVEELASLRKAFESFTRTLWDIGTANDYYGNATIPDGLYAVSNSIDNFARVYRMVHGFDVDECGNTRPKRQQKTEVKTVNPEQLRQMARKARSNGK